MKILGKCGDRVIIIIWNKGWILLLLKYGPKKGKTYMINREEGRSDV